MHQTPAPENLTYVPRFFSEEKMVPLQALPPATSGSLIIKVSIHLWQRLATVNKFKAMLIEKKPRFLIPRGASQSRISDISMFNRVLYENI